MTEKLAPPTPEDLVELLGPTSSLWLELGEAIRTGHPPATDRWVYGGRKYGWSCRLERGKKGILYMTPDTGFFRVGLALPDAARETALVSDLPTPIREALAGSTRAIEGWPVRMQIRTADDVAIALKLAEIKLSS